MLHIHEQDSWPALYWNYEALAPLLAEIRHQQGHLLGRMSAIGFDLQQEASLETLTLTIVKSHQIEGELLEMTEVRSSIAQHLGIEIGGLATTDRHIDGVVEMMLDATQNHQAPLTQERLCAWHATLFPTLRSGLRRITVGMWRSGESGPMQVVSGPVGKEHVHFEAPDATRIPTEMQAFLTWFNTSDAIDPVLKAGIAHFWFITIHPFEDGNGRIARAIADLCLARSDQISERFYSMSAQIEKSRKAYYACLEASQKGTQDITAWLHWFLTCLGEAIRNADTLLTHVLYKVQVLTKAHQHPLHARQHAILLQLLTDFKGKLTTQKYAKLAKCSPDTALRDIQKLIAYGLLQPDPGSGRSTAYTLKKDPA